MAIRALPLKISAESANRIYLNNYRSNVLTGPFSFEMPPAKPQLMLLPFSVYTGHFKVKLQGELGYHESRMKELRDFIDNKTVYVGHNNGGEYRKPKSPVVFTCRMNDGLILRRLNTKDDLLMQWTGVSMYCGALEEPSKLGIVEALLSANQDIMHESKIPPKDAKGEPFMRGPNVKTFALDLLNVEHQRDAFEERFLKIFKADSARKLVFDVVETNVDQIQIYIPFYVFENKRFGFSLYSYVDGVCGIYKREWRNSSTIKFALWSFILSRVLLKDCSIIESLLLAGLSIIPQPFHYWLLSKRREKAREEYKMNVTRARELAKAEEMKRIAREAAERKAAEEESIRLQKEAEEKREEDRKRRAEETESGKRTESKKTKMIKDRLGYYRALDLPANSDLTVEEITRAFRVQAFKYHPDRNVSKKEDAAKTFRKIMQAYNVLKDDEKRIQYNQNGIVSQ